MTVGDIKSITYTQKKASKKSGVTVNAGKWGVFNTDTPAVIIEATSGETKPCFPILPKNVTGEAKGQSPPSMLTYGNNDLEVSILEKGIVAMLTTSGVTYEKGNRVKLGASGLPVLYVEGTDTDFRLIKGVVRRARVVGDGTNTVDIEVGVLN